MTKLINQIEYDSNEGRSTEAFEEILYLLYEASWFHVHSSFAINIYSCDTIMYDNVLLIASVIHFEGRLAFY